MKNRRILCYVELVTSLATVFLFASCSKEPSMPVQKAGDDLAAISMDDLDIFHLASLGKGKSNGSSAAANPATVVSIVNDKPAGETSGPVVTPVATMRDGVVVGTDSRTRVTNLSALPWRTIGKLEQSKGSCTGTLIGPRHVLTAAHCIWNGSAWTTDNLTFTPAYDAGSAPYGKISWSRVQTFTGYTQSRLQEWDIALVILSKPVGNTTGWMSYGYNNSLAVGSVVNVAGYPADRDSTLHMYTASGSIVELQTQLIIHDVDTGDGESGSAIYLYVASSGARTIYGVHDGSYTRTNKTVVNRGVRITQTIYNQLGAWIKAYP